MLPSQGCSATRASKAGVAAAAVRQPPSDVQWCRVLSAVHSEIHSNSDSTRTIRGLPLYHPHPPPLCQSIRVSQSNSDKTRRELEFLGPYM